MLIIPASRDKTVTQTSTSTEKCANGPSLTIVLAINIHTSLFCLPRASLFMPICYLHLKSMPILLR